MKLKNSITAVAVLGLALVGSAQAASPFMTLHETVDAKSGQAKAIESVSNAAEAAIRAEFPNAPNGEAANEAVAKFREEAKGVKDADSVAGLQNKMISDIRVSMTRDANASKAVSAGVDASVEVKSAKSGVSDLFRMTQSAEAGCEATKSGYTVDVSVGSDPLSSRLAVDSATTMLGKIDNHEKAVAKGAESTLVAAVGNLGAIARANLDQADVVAGTEKLEGAIESYIKIQRMKNPEVLVTRSDVVLNVVDPMLAEAGIDEAARTSFEDENSGCFTGVKS